MRWLFTDGVNSFIHFILGLISYIFPIITPVFLLYQFTAHPDKNTIIDLSEFAIGYIVVYLVKQNSSLSRA